MRQKNKEKNVNIQLRKEWIVKDLYKEGKKCKKCQIKK
jgi:hypothetical protein